MFLYLSTGRKISLWKLTAVSPFPTYGHVVLDLVNFVPLSVCILCPKYIQ
uniref:Uncharacterized protein n=1 Tax=Octopus bimaculoides TaxID=37653 RepID=A0A0L8GTL3_OCTBM